MKRLALLVFITSLVSCMNTSEIIETKIQEWKYVEFSLSNLKAIKPDEKEELIINQIILLYKRNAYHLKYNELNFDKLFLDDKKNFKYYIFDINYVDGTQVVIKANSQDKVVDNFLLSEWD